MYVLGGLECFRPRYRLDIRCKTEECLQKTNFRFGSLAKAQWPIDVLVGFKQASTANSANSKIHWLTQKNKNFILDLFCLS